MTALTRPDIAGAAASVRRPETRLSSHISLSLWDRLRKWIADFFGTSRVTVAILPVGSCSRGEDGLPARVAKNLLLSCPP
jgi:hypothetical protein